MSKFVAKFAWSITVSTLLLVANVYAGPIGFSVNTSDDQLYLLNLTSGSTLTVGATGFDSISALDFQPGTGILFGADRLTNQLVTLDATTGEGTVVTQILFDEPGQWVQDMSFTPGGDLLVNAYGFNRATYLVDIGTGNTTKLVDFGGGPHRFGMAVYDSNTYYDIYWENGWLIENTFSLINPPEISNAFIVGTAPLSKIQTSGGLDTIGSTMWGLANIGDPLNTNSTQIVSWDLGNPNPQYSIGSSLISGFHSLAVVVPTPSTLILFGLGFSALIWTRSYKAEKLLAA